MRRDTVRQLPCACQQLMRRHHFPNQAQRFGLLRAEPLARDREIEGGTGADRSGQQDTQAHLESDETKGDERRAEVGGRRTEPDIGGGRQGHATTHGRSEEHTSELQSLMRISYAVFCLKKKKYTK